MQINNRCTDPNFVGLCKLHFSSEECLWNRARKFVLQAEEAEVPMTTFNEDSQVEESQNVTFIDNAAGVTVDAGPSLNHIAKVDNTDDLQLGRFLSRPTLINTTTWSTADLTGIKTTFRPWQLFLNSAPIKRKIENFAYMRARMHVKILVNGTPFQFGAMRACYSPLLGFVDDKVRTNLVSDLPLLIPYSQQPGLFIHPQANAGGEMVLPFFYHQNWLDITNNSDVLNFGTLNYVIYAPLRVAVTGGSTSVSVQTFAWLSDVELMGSTSRLTLQADEYQEGPISKTATAIGAVASVLTSVPYIGPFARASEIGARAVSKIARIFGYTNVPVIENVCAFQPQNAPMLASGHIGTPVQKLTLDPKQELSIDPTLHGLMPQDELALSYLKKKESYFGVTSWSTTDAIDTNLFAMRINPNQSAFVGLFNSIPVQVGSRVYPIPISHISEMFRSWRGTLSLRMKVVCTKFHKGRLKIQYDPRGDLTTTAPPENTVYTTVVDIGEQDDLEIDIPYHQPLAWLKTDPGPVTNWVPGGAMLTRLGTDNGTLTVRVLNALTAPTSGTVNILFFLKGGDDFELANFADHIGGDTNNAVPSLYALQAEDTTDIGPGKLVIGKAPVVEAERYGQNFGECVGSLRSLLHRSTVLDTTQLVAAGVSATTIYQRVLKIMPPSPGFLPQAYPTQATGPVTGLNGTYNYAPMHPITYVSSMFLGTRGGVNFTVTPSTDSVSPVSDFRAVRCTGVTTAAARYPAIVGNYSAASPATAARILNTAVYLQDGLGGMAISATPTNASLTFQMPDYKEYNFALYKPSLALSGTALDGTDRQSVLLNLNIKTPGVATSSVNMSIQFEQCAAPDFTCLFFLCCPTLDYSANIPSAV